MRDYMGLLRVIEEEKSAAHFGDCERRFHAMVSAHFI